MQSKNSVIQYLAILTIVGFAFGCSAQNEAGAGKKTAVSPASVPPQPDVEVQTPAFKDYWYAGTAELSHYNMQQIRYGEVHDGDGILIFVTEDFLTNEQVKLESAANGRPHQTVLKLNFLQEFVTGIYKYNVMTSVFSPINVSTHPRPLKIASSSQEWCGTTYAQMNLRDQTYAVTGHTYFEGRADYTKTVAAAWVESELWTKLRLNPNLLPEGTFSIIPDGYLARSGQWAVQQATASKQPYSGADMPGENLMSYKLSYNTTGRSLSIVYESQSPYRIAGWVERQTVNGDTLEARSVRTNTINEPYWKQNANKFEDMRQRLGLN